jgi:hypothetical protein
VVDKVLDTTFRAHRALTPEKMLYGNFAVVFSSHNISQIEGRYERREVE